MKLVSKIFLLILISIIVYSNTLFFDFVWDDIPFLIENEKVRSLYKFYKFFIEPMPTDLVPVHYRPISMVSFALDYSIWRYNPFGYHLTNLILNSFVCILIFNFIKSFSTPNIAFWSAFLFAVHPVHCDAVSWVMARGDILSTLFMVLSLYLYSIFLKEFSKKSLILAYISFCFAILSKENAVIFPFIIFLFNYYFGNNDKIRFIIPFFLILIVYSWFRFQILPQPLGKDNPFIWSFLTSFRLAFEYVRLLIFPYPLKVIYYNLPIYKNIFDFEWLFFFGFFISLSILVMYIGRKNRIIMFSYGSFIISLLPISGYPNIIDISPIAERYLYFPSLFFILFLCIIIGKSGKYLLRIKCFIVIILGIYTFYWNFNWKNQDIFLNKMLKDAPNYEGVNYELGFLNLKKGNYEESEKYFKRAIEIMPGYLEAYIMLGNLYNAKMMYEKALETYQYALDFVDKNNPQILNNIGTTYQKIGNFYEAINFYNKALEIDNNFFEAHYNLGYLYWRLGKLDYAYQYLTNAYNLSGDRSIISDINYLLKDIENETKNKKRKDN